MGLDSRKRTLGALALAALVPSLLPGTGLAQEGAVAPAAASAAPALLAAGSLRQAFGDILAAYRAAGGPGFDVQYGPSGKLRKEIEGGRVADVFASADSAHTEALAESGLLGASAIFAHNELCVVSTPKAGLNAANLLASLAAPGVRLATSTPVSDPMGDYTWQFFRNADARQPGLYAALDAKALKLSGAANLDPNSTLPYITAFEQDRADAYIMYCTNAVLVTRALPRLQTLRIPDSLNVRSSYGIAARKGSQAGEGLLRFVLSKPGQDILQQHGFH